MGCDIHAYLEVRHFKYSDRNRQEGVWVNADKWIRNPDHILFPEEASEWHAWEILREDRIWKSRWYFLFAILADVRNAWGVKPITEPKGLPQDVSPEVKSQSDGWGVDGHSHSWLTMQEILNWPGWDVKPEHEDRTPREILAEFWEKTVGRMQEQIRGRTEADDVRMVFWFDN